jgi:hypothetical protein
MTESHQDRAAGNERLAAADQRFAAILGDRWQTSGDGIYRLADDTEPESVDDVETHRARAQPESFDRPDVAPLRRWLRRVLS